MTERTVTPAGPVRSCAGAGSCRYHAEKRKADRVFRTMATRGFRTMSGLVVTRAAHPTPRATASRTKGRSTAGGISRGPTKCRCLAGLDTAERAVVDESTVFVITHRHSGSLWGLHLEDHGRDGAHRTQVVAFYDRGNAEAMAERLWAHRLKAHRWPEATLDGKPLWIATAEDVLMMSPSPLQVDEIALRWLVLRLGRSCAGVSVVDPFDDSDGDLRLGGRYLEHAAPASDQAAWLAKMWKRQPFKKQ